MADDGTVVVFESYATDLTSTPNPTGGEVGVYMLDVTLGDGPLLVSKPAGGGAPNGGSTDASVSGDGVFVAYSSTATNLAGGQSGIRDVFVTDTSTGTSTLISRTPGGLGANQDSGHPAISPDGLHVAFESTATDIVAGDPAALTDVFVAPRNPGAVRAVSRTLGGQFGNAESWHPAISFAGRQVVFQSQASNLSPSDTTMLTTDIYRWDRQGNV